MTKSHTSYSSRPPPPPSKLGIGTSSHLISKFKPKIRIIHVYAPEIIKTDVANFRELVQRLTGKPEDEGERGGRRRAKTKTTPPTRLDQTGSQIKQRMIMEEQQGEFMSLQNGLRIKKEEENDDQSQMWGRSRSNGKLSGGFLEGFSELDCFMEELSTMPVV
ncbi:VQ motif-containing protein 25-like [Prosopis cineraria]|uniref:VQ motif-containing protein 25-like n=1 Tax=Prosopis cineraria TaxID=364024 RepID=UPI00240F2B62|nr:VQ motif-containing protein 25-like [Prosopis cineraria]